MAGNAPRGLYRLGAEGAWVRMGAGDALRSGEAYWVYTRGASQFVAPLELSFQGLEALDYPAGSTFKEMQFRQVASGVDGVEVAARMGHVQPEHELPLQVNESSPQEDQRWGDLPNGYPVAVAAGSVRTVRLAVKRERLRDLVYEGVMEVRGGGAWHRIPLRVERDVPGAVARPEQPFSPVGLWLGSASITHVSEVNGLTTNYVSRLETNLVNGVATVVERASTEVRNVTVGTRPTPVRDPFDIRLILHGDTNGVLRLLQQVTLLTRPTGGDAAGQGGGEPVLVTSPGSFLRYQGASLRGRDLVGRRFSTPFFPMASTDGVPFDRTLGPGRTVVASWALPSDAPVNPFKHRYHPDHDNLDASFRVFREEAYPVRRTVRLTLPDRQGADGRPGVGQDALQGVYEEVLERLHRTPITVRGTFQVRRILPVGALDLSTP